MSIMDLDQFEDPGSRSGRTFVIILVLIAASIAFYFALGMPGMDHSPTTPATEHEKMDM